MHLYSDLFMFVYKFQNEAQTILTSQEVEYDLFEHRFVNLGVCDGV